ncbi:vWA domain-containing protein [Xanthobacter sp. AM11]|uniref:vWA domain-containing protein n=1 Tax=Xanthobacter sp. AM11 TaxID=3380643 RepID=UPI0039BF4ABB
MPAGFHFLRPEWLLAFLPACLLCAMLWRRLRTGGSDWARVVEPHLLRHLAATGGQRGARWPVPVLLAGWAAAILAMAGPAYERLPQPDAGRADPVVAVVSLSSSMAAKDESPSRLGAATLKVEDLVERMRGVEVGLVVYADVPFVATPLTVDGRTTAQLLTDLDTDLVRAVAVRPAPALRKAVELMRNTGAVRGRILLFADEPGDAAAAAHAAADAAAAGFTVSVVGVGRADGAAAGSPLDAAGLAAIAASGGGTYTHLSADGSDLDAVLAATPVPAAEAGGTLPADIWADLGPVVLLVALLLAPLAFRRGWIIILLLAAVPGLLPPNPAAAASLGPVESWADLWARPDQQGASAFGEGRYEAAAQQFEDPAWRAAALYRAGDYAAAAEAFAAIAGADYNRGNALARAGQLEAAVSAYDAALAADPGAADARANRDLVQGLIDRRKAQEEQKKKEAEKNAPGGGGGNPPGGDDGGGTPPPGGGDQAPDSRNAPPPPASPSADTAQRPPPGPAPLPPRRPPELAAAPAAPPPAALPPAAPPPAAPAAKEPPAPPPSSSPPPEEPRPPPSRIAPTQSLAPQADNTPDVTPPPSLSEDAQSREQLLRSVPDAPGALLGARIRSHYRGMPERMLDEK